MKKAILFLLFILIFSSCAKPSPKIIDTITDEQRQEVETELKQWIDDWETLSDIYLKNKDNEVVKGEMNEIAGHYNKLILKYGYFKAFTIRLLYPRDEKCLSPASDRAFVLSEDRIEPQA